MRDMTQQLVESAMSSALNVVRAASHAAGDADEIAQRDPALAARLHVVAAQMYALADVARDAERDLAQIQAELRANMRGGQ